MKDLEFHVGEKDSGKADKVLSDFDEACAYAISQCVAKGVTMVIDVVTWSKIAALTWGGDAALEVYEEDPDASVHERIVIKAEAQGPVR